MKTLFLTENLFVIYALISAIFIIFLAGIWLYFSKKLKKADNTLRDANMKIVLHEERMRKYLEIEYLCEKYRQQLTDLTVENTELKAKIYYEQQQAYNKLKTLQETHDQLTETFKNLSNQALLANNEAFLNLAKTNMERVYESTKYDIEQKQKSFGDLVDPVQKALSSVDQKIDLLEKERIGAYSDLRRHLLDLVVTQKELKGETANLVKALRTPNARGQWGEMQLRRVVEMAGMIAHCDFFEQVSVDEGRLRPDMIINLPGNKQVVIDAKAPLSAYLAALETSEDTLKAQHLENHARQVRAHIRSLSQRAYWEQFNETPEFVIMFLPGGSFFCAALEKDPTLIEVGVREKVILATPTTLIALLRTVAYGWHRESTTDNARHIGELGRILYKRLSDMNNHVNRLGRHIQQTVDAYNQTVGTLEKRVLVTARKFQDLDKGLQDQNLEINSLDSMTRSLQSIEGFDSEPIKLQN